jgi:integrase
VEFNPWKKARKTLPRVPPPQPKPFTEEEIRKILELFRSDARLRHYYDFVEFRLRTGARSGEVAGLRWKNVSKDCRRIRIAESLSDGKRQGTKTGEEREILLSKGLQDLLLKRKPPDSQPDELVFKTVRGKGILPGGFASKYWKPALEQLDIPYRKPYTTRSTFASHALHKGISPAQVVKFTGHRDQSTLFRHYSGVIQEPELPDLWE